MAEINTVVELVPKIEWGDQVGECAVCGEKPTHLFIAQLAEQTVTSTYVPGQLIAMAYCSKPVCVEDRDYSALDNGRLIWPIIET